MDGRTSELATQQIGNRYDMILIGARRARELSRGWRPQIRGRNGIIVTALNEIETGVVGRDYLLKPQNIDRRERPPKEPDSDS